MIKIIYDNYLSKIEGITPEQFLFLRDILKYEVPYMERKSTSNFTGYMPERWKYLINTKGFFYSGLLQDVIDALNAKKIPFEFESRVKFPEMSEEDIKIGFMRLKEMPVSPRPYQMEAILTAVDSKRGVVVAGTGAGKGVIISGICSFIYEKTLILLHSVDIAEQLSKEIFEYTSIPTGLIKGGRWETDKLITVAVIDSVRSKTQKKMSKEVKKWLDSIKVLIIDECHHATANSYENFLEKCSAPYRYGLTATALGSYYKGENGLTSNAPLLKGLLGSPVWIKTSKDLIDEGWLSVPTIYVMENDLGWNKDEHDIGLYSDEETKWLIENESRNKIAVNLICETISKDKNVIVFINRIEHGKILVKMLEEANVDSSTIRYAYGEINGPARQKMFKEFKSGEAKILIGTVLNEGLNFQINVGINLGGGMSPRTAIQRIGRILRKPRSESGDVDTSTPSYTDYYDFRDKGHPIFVKHGKERLNIYEELGHDVKIVKMKDKPVKKAKQSVDITEL